MKSSVVIPVLYPAAALRSVATDKPDSKVPYVVTDTAILDQEDIASGIKDKTFTVYREPSQWVVRRWFTPKQRRNHENTLTRMQAQVMRITPAGAIDEFGEIRKDLITQAGLIEDGVVEQLQALNESIQRINIEFYCNMPPHHLTILDDVVGGDTILNEFIPAAIAAIDELNTPTKS
jgi:hypothetical protein